MTTSSFELINPDPHWVRKWWQWILQIPASKNPAYGYKGSYLEVPSPQNQPYDKEDVWFLAGAFNDGSLPHTCNIAHRTVTDIPPNKKQQELEELEKKVKEEMDVINPESLYVTVDGQEIPNLAQYRADTDTVFPITVNGKDNVVKMKHVLGRPIKLWAKGDGYWLFVKPLPPGEHDIHSFGSCLQGKIQIEIHYKLNIIVSVDK